MILIHPGKLRVNEKIRVKGPVSIVLADLAEIVEAVAESFTKAGLSADKTKKLVLFAVRNAFLPGGSFEAVLSERGAAFIRDTLGEAAND